MPCAGSGGVDPVRFDDHADDRPSATRYLHERAHQTLIDGFHPATSGIESLITDGVESDVLDRYFRLWLDRLGVSEARFAELFEDLQLTRSPTSLASHLGSSSIVVD